jgi:hypothetical protein
MTERKSSSRIIPPVESGVVVVPEEGLVRAYMINKDIKHILKENIAQRTIDRVNDYDKFLGTFFADKEPRRHKHAKAGYSTTRDQLDDEIYEADLQLTDGGVRHIRLVTTFRNKTYVVAKHASISDSNSLQKNQIKINFINNHISMQHDEVHVTLADGQPYLDPITYKKNNPSLYPDILDYFKVELLKLKGASK